MNKDSNYWTSWRNGRPSRRRVLGAGATFGVGAAALGLVGCGDDDDDDSASDANATAPSSATASTASALPDHPLYKGLPGGKRGGKFVFQQSDDPVTSDPHNQEEPAVHSLVQPVYNGLFFPWEAVPGTREVMGELVEKWEQPTPLELVMHIRKGVKFQNVAPVNGRELVAKDIEFNIKRMTTPNPENQVRAFLSPVTGVEVIDNYTVKLKLSQPFAPLLMNLAHTWMSILPHEIVDDDSVTKKPIGTGGFILDKWERGVKATWKRNPDYWKPGLPFLDEMEMQIILDRAVFEAKFLSGELDIIPVQIVGSKDEIIKADMEKFNSKVPSTFIEVQASSVAKFHMQFNTTVKPFDDERVRQALSHAWPADQFIANFLAGRGTRTAEVAAGNTFWKARNEDMPAFDIAKAKALLEQAGQTGLKTESWVSKQYSGTTIAPIVQGLMKQTLGIDIAAKVLQDAEWFTEVYRGRGGYPMSAKADWSFDDPDRTLYEWFHSKGVNRRQGINDPALDSLLDKQRAELDTNARLKLVQEVQKLIMDKAYTVGLFGSPSITVVPKYLNYLDIRGGNVGTYRIRDIISVTGGPRAS